MWMGGKKHDTRTQLQEYELQLRTKITVSICRTGFSF